MASTMDNVTAIDMPLEVPIDVDNKKTRKPSLPEKHGKFIQFAHFVINTIFVDLIDGHVSKEQLTEAFHVFASVDQQLAFVDEFFANAKDNKKTMRKAVQDYARAAAKAAKAALPKAPRKPRAKNNDTTDATDATDATAETPKTPRAKKGSKTVVNTQTELVNELVRLANSTDIHVVDPVPVEPPPVAVDKKAEAAAKKAAKDAESAAKKAAKDAEAAAKKAAKDAEVAAKKASKKPTKPATKNTPKAPVVQHPLPQTDAKVLPDVHVDTEHDADGDAEDVTLFNYHGKDYLIADDDSVYDIDTQEQIGRFNRATSLLELI